MKSFNWGKHFQTGLSEVDEQHHELVELINNLSDLLTENELIFEDIELTYNKLVDYAEYHFCEEEKMMAETGLDERHLNEHIVIHQNFLHEVIQMHSILTPDNPQSAQDLLDFLIHWLGYHILGTDQNMARQIKSIQSGLSAGEAYEKDEHERNSSTEPLLGALSGLFQQVSKRNNELIVLNQSLEEKVKRRTKALSEANRHFEELALTDVLTGLPNRRFAMQQLTLMWNEAKANNKSLSCMMIDVDYFKEVNDAYGHDAGDFVLCELSKALRHSVRTDDVVSRLGGDEFFILCPHTDAVGVMNIGKTAHQLINQLNVKTGSGQWKGSISVGVASLKSEMESYEELIKAADKGVYAAKSDGKNCVRSAS